MARSRAAQVLGWRRRAAWLWARGLPTVLLSAALVGASAGAFAPTLGPGPRVGQELASPVTPIRVTPRPVVGAVVTLGDSVAAGSRCGCTPYATLLGQGLAQRTDRVVSVANLGHNGLTSAGLLSQLETAGVRRLLSRATVVTVTIGANDFDASTASDSACAGAGCYAGTLAAMSARVRAALAEIGALAPRDARVLVTGYWNVFLDGEVGRAQGAAYVANSDALTRRVNSALQAEAETAHDTYVDEYGPFESASLSGLTALLAPDGDHPSAAGHALIAQLLLAALVRPQPR